MKTFHVVPHAFKENELWIAIVEEGQMMTQTIDITPEQAFKLSQDLAVAVQEIIKQDETTN